LRDSTSLRGNTLMGAGVSSRGHEKLSPEDGMTPPGYSAAMIAGMPVRIAA
jgi:hypothetical protein